MPFKGTIMLKVPKLLTPASVNGDFPRCVSPYGNESKEGAIRRFTVLGGGGGKLQFSGDRISCHTGMCLKKLKSQSVLLLKILPSNYFRQFW